MVGRTIKFDLADEVATVRLGEDIAAALQPGDLVTMMGDLGAGKTTLARAIIRSLAAEPALEVPSPTYTLVQTYPTPVPVAHFDFYRLTSPAEIDDLGIDEALDDGIAIVEWPENAGGSLPEPALAIALTESVDGGRSVVMEPSPAMEHPISRSLDIREFLHGAGWGNAHRCPLAGDASTRAYEEVDLAGCTMRLVMNSPEQSDGPPVKDGLPYSRVAKLSESVVPFVAVDHCLRQHGFSAPEIFAANLEAGFLLLEHLGSEGVVDSGGQPIAERYEAASRLLSELHRRDWPSRIEAPFGADHVVPDYDHDAMMIEVGLLLDWYVPAMTGKPVDDCDRHEFDKAWSQVISNLEGVETSLVLRDFHSPNLIWRDSLVGNDRIGLIDFQDAVIGPSAYDLVSLAQDARVTVDRDLETRLVARYCELRSAAGVFDEDLFRKTYAIMSVQRCSKILGIFVRLDRRDGKPAYLKHLPRMRDYLVRSIEHEALAPVRDLYRCWRLLDGETV